MNIKLFEFDKLPKDKQVQEINKFKKDYKHNYNQMGLIVNDKNMDKDCNTHMSKQWYFMECGVYFNIKFKKL